MAIKMLNLVDTPGKYQRLLNGVRFFHRGREFDIRKISEADADALAADPLCRFLGKEGVEKKSAEVAQSAPTTQGKKAGDASVDSNAAKSPIPTGKKD